jgi:hypothetical protein
MNGTPRGSGDRLTGFRCRCSDRTNDGEDFIFADDLLRRADGFLRLIAVVERFKLERAAGNPAMTICVVKRSQDASAHALAQILGRSGECRDLTEYDFTVRNAVLGERGIAEESDDNSERNSKLIGDHLRFLHAFP